jgi:hypothetical protein
LIIFGISQKAVVDRGEIETVRRQQDNAFICKRIFSRDFYVRSLFFQQLFGLGQQLIEIIDAQIESAPQLMIRAAAHAGFLQHFEQLDLFFFGSFDKIKNIHLYSYPSRSTKSGRQILPLQFLKIFSRAQPVPPKRYSLSAQRDHDRESRAAL